MGSGVTYHEREIKIVQIEKVYNLGRSHSYEYEVRAVSVDDPNDVWVLSGGDTLYEAITYASHTG